MKKISLDEYIKRIEERYPNEKFEILEYDCYSKPVKIRCCNCNKIIEYGKANTFLSQNKKNGCIECSENYQKRQQRMEKLLEKYDILDSYVKNTHKYYIVKCKNCGHIRDYTLYGLDKNGCGCEGYNYKKRTPEILIQQINDKSDDEYELVGEYINQTTPILLRHKKCGFIRKAYPHDAVSKGISCPKCYPISSKESKMVRAITNWLEENNVIFDKEVPLKESRQKFDFILFFKDKQVAVEFNGEQHYKETDRFSMTLAEQQDRDKRKIEYCEKHDLPLYIFDYTQSKEKIFSQLKEICNKFNDYPEGEYTTSDW